MVSKKTSAGAEDNQNCIHGLFIMLRAVGVVQASHLKVADIRRNKITGVRKVNGNTEMKKNASAEVEARDQKEAITNILQAGLQTGPE